MEESEVSVLGSYFIIHPCDSTVVICYLIWPCDIAVRITYLVSHSSSLSYNTNIIRCTSLGFPSCCPESTRPMDSCFQGTSCENLMMYGRLYQHTRVVLYNNQYNIICVHIFSCSLSLSQAVEFFQASSATSSPPKLKISRSCTPL